MWVVALPNIKIYHKTIIIKTMWYISKGRDTPDLYNSIGDAPNAYNCTFKRPNLIVYKSYLSRTTK